MQTLPCINIAPLLRLSAAAAATTVREIETACHQIGFMSISGHGIPASVIRGVRRAVISIFDLPLEAKMRLRIRPQNYRGYIPLGFFSPNNAAGAPDQYEGYKLHHETRADDPIRQSCDLYGPNIWPDDVPGVKQTILRYWKACDHITGALLDTFTLILGIDGAKLRSAFHQPLTNMTLLHYPPTAGDNPAYGIHPHKDTDAFTILAPDRVGGLMVKTSQADEWIQAPVSPELLIVNFGDLLELWSEGYFVSTPHKVVNQAGQQRYSFPYFAVPRFDTVVVPLRAPTAGFRRNEVHVGEVSKEVWRTNWPDTHPVDPTWHLGTLSE